MKRIQLLLCLAIITQAALGHECGPPLITLKVGQTCPWRITADRVEVSSDYSPILSGAEGICSALPQKPFKSRHGDFLITGHAPGTNFLTVNWFYAGTGASGRCQVMIVVNPADGIATLDTHTREGTLSSYSGGQSVHARWLKALLDTNIPPQTLKLLVLTECYGGNIAFSSSFKEAPNTAIISATSPNQTGKYGGYHDDAARALKPKDGWSAFDVHETASEGKTSLEPPAGHGAEPSKTNHFKESEWPRFAGGLNMADFSLQPVSATGPIRSRHIVIYMGSPEVKNIRIQKHGDATQNSQFGTSTPIDDVADARVIFDNFKNEPNTTLHTAGGPPAAPNSALGTNGWQYRGDYWGLERAIRDAGNAIRSSPDPAAEQFILFVGDHGGQGADADLATPAVATPQSKTGLTSNFKPLSLNDPELGKLLEDIENRPGFSLGLVEQPSRSPNSLSSSSRPPPPPLQNASLELIVETLGGSILRLTDYEIEARDLNEDGIIGNAPNEEYRIFFPMDERLLAGPFGREPLTISLQNKTASTFLVTSLSQETGSIGRGTSPIPQPYFAQIKGNANSLDALVRAVPGYSFNLEASSDLKTWTILRFVHLADEETWINIPRANPSRPEFYRFRFAE